MLHAVNTQHGLQRIGPSAIARLGIKRLDDSGHILPWQNLLHAECGRKIVSGHDSRNYALFGQEAIGFYVVAGENEYVPARGRQP